MCRAEAMASTNPATFRSSVGLRGPGKADRTHCGEGVEAVQFRGAEAWPPQNRVAVSPVWG